MDKALDEEARREDIAGHESVEEDGNPCIFGDGMPVPAVSSEVVMFRCDKMARMFLPRVCIHRKETRLVRLNFTIYLGQIVGLPEASIVGSKPEMNVECVTYER